MARREIEVTGGVDTHQDTHTAVEVDAAGRVLGTREFAATAAGYRALLGWLRGHGALVLVGVEGTGVYGAGLARLLDAAAVPMVEVDRPDRKARRAQGKSDPADAIAAARAALAAVRTGVPKQRDGRVEALRNLRVARRSAVAGRATVLRQMRMLVVTAPEPLRASLRGRSARGLVAACAAARPDASNAADPAVAARVALRALARRHQQLTTEIDELDNTIAPLVAAAAPRRVTSFVLGARVIAVASWPRGVRAVSTARRPRRRAGFAAAGVGGHRRSPGAGVAADRGGRCRQVADRPGARRGGRRSRRSGAGGTGGRHGEPVAVPSTDGGVVLPSPAA